MSSKISHHFKLHFHAIHHLLSVSLPLSSILFVNLAANFLAILMLSTLGKLDWAAAALGMATFIAIVTPANMVLNSVGLLVRYRIQQHFPPAAIGKIFQQALWLAIFLAFLSGLLLWHATDILSFFKQDSRLILRLEPYFKLCVLVIIPFFIGSILIQFLVGIGRSNLIFLHAIINFFLIVFLSYGLILGKFHLPQMGLCGFPLAIFSANLLSCSGLGLYCFLHPAFKPYQLLVECFHFDVEILRKLLGLGYPIGLQYAGELTAVTFSTYMMGLFGVNALAASQIVSQYTSPIILFFMCLSQGVSLLISDAYATQNKLATLQYLRAAASLMMACFFVIFVAFSLFPVPLIRLYLSAPYSPEWVDLTKQLFVIASFMLLIDGSRFFFSAGIRGFHDTKTPMWVGLAGLWGVSLPLSYFIGLYLGFGPVGLRIGFLFGFFIASLTLGFRLKAMVKNRMQINQILYPASPTTSYV